MAMISFNCPFCKYDAITVSKDGQSLIFCESCDIYWGKTVEQITETLKSPLLKHAFESVPTYKKSVHTKTDKSWYAFAILLILIAVALI